jgi:hypothetical protein
MSLRESARDDMCGPRLYRCIACDGNRHVGATNWHPDIAADHAPAHPPGNYHAVKFCICPRPAGGQAPLAFPSTVNRVCKMALFMGAHGAAP